MTTHTPAGDLPHVAFQPMTLAWVLKRTALAVAILMVSIGTMAWLTYASIDPSLDGEAQTLESGPIAPVTNVKVSL
jgi:K+-transporting ATPase A subunit